MLELKFKEAPFEELETPLQQQVAGAPDISSRNVFSNIRAYIGDAPVAFSVKDVYQQLGKSIPPEIDLYDGFRVWMIPTRINILKDGGWAEPITAGLELEYRNDDQDVNLNRRITCCVVSMLPSPTYLQQGHLETSASGEVSPTGEFVGGTDFLGLSSELPLSANLKLGISASLKWGVGFKFTVKAPLISAVGIGSSRAEWVFNEESTELHGKDIETWTMLALPKRMQKLKYRVRLYIVLRTAFFKTRHNSGWKQLECSLISPPALTIT